MFVNDIVIDTVYDWYIWRSKRCCGRQEDFISILWDSVFSVVVNLVLRYQECIYYELLAVPGAYEPPKATMIN